MFEAITGIFFGFFGFFAALVFVFFIGVSIVYFYKRNKIIKGLVRKGMPKKVAKNLLDQVPGNVLADYSADEMVSNLFRQWNISSMAAEWDVGSWR
jgi:hypothetical protein